MKTRAWLWRVLVLLALVLVFAAYVTPQSTVVLANLWAMCGF